jgi:DNA helicase TIP49 (TBP-interacting protein)
LGLDENGNAILPEASGLVGQGKAREVRIKYSMIKIYYEQILLFELTQM